MGSLRWRVYARRFQCWLQTVGRKCHGFRFGPVRAWEIACVVWPYPPDAWQRLEASDDA